MRRVRIYGAPYPAQKPFANFAPTPFAIPATSTYIQPVPSGTMDINALVISGSDPGAVPGDSTNHPFIWRFWGRNRIDGRLKGLALSRLSATVIGENCTIANDNRAPVAMAA